MLNNPDGVALVYTVGGAVFLIALFAGFVRTAIRVIFTPASAYESGHRPVLLVRDLVVIGGFSVTMTAITLIRFLPPETRIAVTQGNVWWALLTTVPICIAVLAYLYAEFFLIERRPK